MRVSYLGTCPQWAGQSRWVGGEPLLGTCGTVSDQPSFKDWMIELIVQIWINNAPERASLEGSVSFPIHLVCLHWLTREGRSSKWGLFPIVRVDKRNQLHISMCQGKGELPWFHLVLASRMGFPHPVDASSLRCWWKTDSHTGRMESEFSEVGKLSVFLTGSPSTS